MIKSGQQVKQEMQSSGRENVRQFQITIEGHLHPRWSERFGEMDIMHMPDGTTTLIDNIPDQAA